MLKIAPNPDAAYEICTMFALDCTSRSRVIENGYNFTSSPNEDSYERVIEKDSNEDFYVSPRQPINITFVLRPTLEIPYRNQTVQVYPAN